ncbi:MAG TPA: hypothetical protein DCO79_06885 [Spirochaeta sp.]|nr:hypothetical protein [Spirochaeta sp.]
MKKIVFLLLLFCTGLSLYAIDGFTFKDPALRMLLKAQQENNQAWASNEAFLEAGVLEYESARSMLYPQLNAGLDGGAASSYINSTPVGIELGDLYALSVSPSLSVSQLLPSSGILTGSVTDELDATITKESDSSRQLEWDESTLSFVIGISQPLFFGNAYKAARTQLTESHEISRITYLDNRNNLISSVLNDYYNLIQTAYQLQLVQSRLTTNTEFEKKMLREHSLGMWTKGQLNSAKAARLQSEVDLIRTLSEYSSAGDKIKTLYGVELNIDISSVDIETIPFNAETLAPFQLIEEGNPETQINKKRIAIAEADTVITKKNSAFNLNLGSSYSLTNDINAEGFVSDGSLNSLAFTLGLSMPLLDGGSARKTIELKQIQAGKLGKDFNEQKKNTASQLQALLNSITLSKKLAEIYLVQEETAAFDYETGSRELELGRITQKELLELQIALDDTRLTILENKINYNLTVLQIYRQLGLDLSLLTGREGAE